MTQVIVLGWDALDSELLEAFDLGEAFGSHTKRIETHSNPVIEEPHTKEVWPSMITGKLPEEHGIRAISEGSGVEWANPVLNKTSNVANRIVPRQILVEIGSRLRDRGFGLDAVETSYYEKNDLPTVFDDCGGRAISIPNYVTAYDITHELDANRDSLWAALQADGTVAEGIEPQVDLPTVYDILGSALGKRLGHTLSAMHAGHDLVWTWFGILDSVGHMDPAISVPLQEDWYRVAADVDAVLRRAAPADAVVLSVSDHGLQNGDHTDYATLGTDSPEALEAIDSITDIRPWIKSTLAASGGQSNRSIDAEEFETVNETLEDLGYI